MQLVKKPPAVRETGVRSLGWEGPLEKGKATHSSILAWRIPWTVQYMGSQRVQHDWETFTCKHFFDSLVAQIVKNLHAMWETRAPSLGLEHPLEKEMTIHSSILAWKIPWTEEPQSVRHDWAALLSVFKSFIYWNALVSRKLENTGFLWSPHSCVNLGVFLFAYALFP